MENIKKNCEKNNFGWNLIDFLHEYRYDSFVIADVADWFQINIGYRPRTKTIISELRDYIHERGTISLFPLPRGTYLILR